MSTRTLVVIALGALAAASTVCAANVADPLQLAQSSANAPPAPGPPSRAVRGTLDHRVKVLAKALDLDERQQAELWKILQSQRQAVTKIWSDPALLSAERVPATRAVEDRTANQIREMLTDEQKKRYNPAKPQGTQSPPPNVADWIETQARQRE